jgi:hypothetical protein
MFEETLRRMDELVGRNSVVNVDAASFMGQYNRFVMMRLMKEKMVEAGWDGEDVIEVMCIVYEAEVDELLTLCMRVVELVNDDGNEVSIDKEDYDEMITDLLTDYVLWSVNQSDMEVVEELLEDDEE